LGGAILTITVQSAVPCVEATDQMALSISRQAIVDAGVDSIICETGTYTIPDAAATYATSLTWTSSGTGTFSDLHAIHPTYLPSPNDLDDGSVTLTLTATSAEPCVDAVDQLVLEFSKQATVNAGPDATICETGTYELIGASHTDAVSILWTTSGSGTFSDATVLNPVYLPGVADIALGAVTLTITVQSAVPCVEATDAMVLNISRQALAFAGVDSIICETGTYRIRSISQVRMISMMVL
jgi:hypothetical protein